MYEFCKVEGWGRSVNLGTDRLTANRSMLTECRFLLVAMSFREDVMRAASAGEGRMPSRGRRRYFVFLVRRSSPLTAR